MKKPLRVEDDGCYIKVVDVDGKNVAMMMGWPGHEDTMRANAREIVEAVNKTSAGPHARGDAAT